MTPTPPSPPLPFWLTGEPSPLLCVPGPAKGLAQRDSTEERAPGLYPQVLTQVSLWGLGRQEGEPWLAASHRKRVALSWQEGQLSKFLKSFPVAVRDRALLLTASSPRRRGKVCALSHFPGLGVVTWSHSRGPWGPLRRPQSGLPQGRKPRVTDGQTASASRGPNCLLWVVFGAAGGTTAPGPAGHGHHACHLSLVLENSG